MNTIKVTGVHRFSSNASEENPLGLKNGDDVSEWVYGIFKNYSVLSKADQIMRTGCIKVYGWVYHFSINCYVVKQHGAWEECFAPNKTLLRKCIPGKVDMIVAID